MLSPIKDSSSDQLGFSQGFMLIDTGGLYLSCRKSIPEMVGFFVVYL